MRLFTAYPTCQVQFQQKYPSTFEPSLAMLVAWLIADLMINPQIENYGLSCSFIYILVFFYYCVYCPLLTIYISTPKTPGNKTKFVVKLAHQPTNQHNCCQKLLSTVIQEIDLPGTSYNDGSPLGAGCLQGLGLGPDRSQIHISSLI